MEKSKLEEIHICVCNYNAGTHVKDCIESIIHSPDICRLNIWDNASKDISRKLIMEQAAWFDLFDLYDENVGKAKAVNTMAGATGLRDDDLIISLDSDISIVDNSFYDYVQRCWELMSGKISCMVCWQIGNSLYKRDFKWSQYKDIDYFIPKEGYGHGIAGGCIITSGRNWNLVGGYRENMGPNGTAAMYGGMDGWMLYDLYKKTNKPICVIKQLMVHHPEEFNKKYQVWKDQQHNDLLKLGHTKTTKGFYD